MQASLNLGSTHFGICCFVNITFDFSGVRFQILHYTIVDMDWRLSPIEFVVWKITSFAWRATWSRTATLISACWKNRLNSVQPRVGKIVNTIRIWCQRYFNFYRDRRSIDVLKTYNFFTKCSRSSLLINLCHSLVTFCWALATPALLPAPDPATTLPAPGIAFRSRLSASCNCPTNNIRVKL